MDGHERMMNLQLGTQYDAFAKLAKAIILSGIKSNDETFLKSAWANTLAEVCKMDQEMHDPGRLTRAYV